MKADKLAKMRSISAIKIQCLVRKRLAYKRIYRLRAFRDEAIRHEKERAARVIQEKYRDFINRRWQTALRRAARKKNAEEKLIFKKRTSAVF
jgi:hypothetical protein